MSQQRLINLDLDAPERERADLASFASRERGVPEQTRYAAEALRDCERLLGHGFASSDDWVIS
jgi:hypothetical protein